MALPCLDQAVLVGMEHQIDINEVERWSAGEGKNDLFKQIRGKLTSKK